MVREQASELVADLGSWERYGRQLLEWGGLPEPRKTERSEPLSREQLQGAAELAQASLGQSPAGPWQEAALALLGKLDQQLLADLDPSNPALPLQLQAQYAELLESYTYLRTTLLRDEGADLDA